ncbi:hypothetical protein ABZ907_37900 [Nonomuraea wenchangensis]
MSDGTRRAFLRRTGLIGGGLARRAGARRLWRRERRWPGGHVGGRDDRLLDARPGLREDAVPSLIMFILLRKQLLDGLTAGAVKS